MDSDTAATFNPLALASQTTLSTVEAGHCGLLDRGMGLPSKEPAPSLDNSVHKSPQKGSWTRRQRRLFQRGMSGIEVAWSLGEEVRFLTLTSSNQSVIEEMSRNWACFVKRVRRAFGKFEYVAAREVEPSVRVNIHCLFRGSFVPQAWISAAWEELHKAKIVYVELVRKGFRTSKRAVAAYLVKYLGKGLSTVDTPSYRIWCSWGWVFRGFVGFWHRVVRHYQDKAVYVWAKFLRGEIELFDRLLDRGRFLNVQTTINV